MGYPITLVNMFFMGYPKNIMTRRDSQKRAEKAYETKRAKKPVGCRLSIEDIERFDRVRGEESRSAVIERLLLDWIASK